MKPRGGLTAARAIGAYERHFRKLASVDLLIIDDMGLNVLPAKGGKILLEIIVRRHENRSTPMTSTRPGEELGKLLCDVLPAASAIFDGLLHHAEVIPMT